ncbi:MAG TPA: hypothetical protein VEH56_08530 [Candidatus Saccharimonadales bacterium]|nr:hypothetical protein [Candidatus Saccharimonadales bacterium]
MKFLNAAKAYKANAIILGGDITGKMIIPLVPKADKTYTVYGGDAIGTFEVSDVEEIKKKIMGSGYYPYIMSDQEYDHMRTEKNELDTLFSELMKQQVERWNNIAEERLKGTEVKCYISPGNDDRFIIDSVIGGGSSVVNPEDQVVDIGGYEMITSGFVPPTPWNTSRECSEEELARKIENMTTKVQAMPKCIFNIHTPPHNSKLDEAPLLDENLRPIQKGGSPVIAAVGSTAVRTAIEKHQPLMGLHGHIHEGRGAQKIGKTLCLNPGSEYGEAVLRGVIVNLDGAKIKSYVFTSG